MTVAFNDSDHSVSSVGGRLQLKRASTYDPCYDVHPPMTHVMTVAFNDSDHSVSSVGGRLQLKRASTYDPCYDCSI